MRTIQQAYTVPCTYQDFRSYVATLHNLWPKRPTLQDTTRGAKTLLIISDVLAMRAPFSPLPE